MCNGKTKGALILCGFLHFCLQFDANTNNEFYTHSLRLTQHPIGAMLQFDATADADANAHA